MSGNIQGPATKQQEQGLTVIMTWVQVHGTLPRAEDIAAVMGLDVNTVAAEVAALERDGWVTVE